MINYDEYKDYSLLKWHLDHLEDKLYTIFVEAQIRGEWKLLASSNIYTSYELLGIAVLDSAIVHCCKYPEYLTWYIKIDLDKKGIVVE